AVTPTRMVGNTKKEFVDEITFPEKTGDERQLVEHLWARRKVGYLLNEIRANGQVKELVEEVTKLARRHGIATPYTSYLLVPDGTPTATPKTEPSGVPDVRFGGQGGVFGQFGVGGGMNMGMNAGGSRANMNVGQFGQVGFGRGGMNLGGFAGQFGGPRMATPDVKIVSPAPQSLDSTPVLEFAQTLRQAGFDGK